MVRDGMPFLLSLMLASLLTCGAMCARETIAAPSGFCEKLKPCQLLVQSDAERIIGLPVRLTEDTSELKGDVRQCRCAYKGVSKDKESGEDINLFFSLEQKEGNPSAEQARQVLNSTKEANAHDLAILDLPAIGEEAFLLSNEANSHLIMARKGAIVMRLQVKNPAEKRSLDELKTFAAKVFKEIK